MCQRHLTTFKVKQDIFHAFFGHPKGSEPVQQGSTEPPSSDQPMLDAEEESGDHSVPKTGDAASHEDMTGIEFTGNQGPQIDPEAPPEVREVEDTVVQAHGQSISPASRPVTMMLPVGPSGQGHDAALVLGAKQSLPWQVNVREFILQHLSSPDSQYVMIYRVDTNQYEFHENNRRELIEWYRKNKSEGRWQFLCVDQAERIHHISALDIFTTIERSGPIILYEPAQSEVHAFS